MLARAEFSTRYWRWGESPVSFGSTPGRGLPGRSSKPGFERSLVSRAGLDHGEKQRLMARAAGRVGGDGPEPSAGSDGTRRPKAASNSHALTGQYFEASGLSLLSTTLGVSHHAEPPADNWKSVTYRSFNSGRLMPTMWIVEKECPMSVPRKEGSLE